MAESVGLLAQALATPAIAGVYTTPTGRTTVLSTILICNYGQATTFQLSIARANSTDEPKQYLYFNTPLPAGRSFAVTLGITLGDNDTVRVQAPGQVSVNVFGVEIS